MFVVHNQTFSSLRKLVKAEDNQKQEPRVYYVSIKLVFVSNVGNICGIFERT